MPHTERELEACYVQMLCMGLSGMSGVATGGGGGINFDIVTEDNEPIVTEDEDHITYEFQIFSLQAYHYGSYVQVYWPHTNLAEDYRLESSADGENWTVLEAATTDNSYTDNSPPGATAYYRIRPHSTELGNGDYIETLAFAPSSITGNVLWLDASLGTYQSSGGSAATADGDVVGEWQDQSGSGNHATQATGSKKPTLRTNVLNGLPVLRFDGSNDGLAPSGFTVASAHTIFVVAKAANSGGNYSVLTDDDGVPQLFCNGQWNLFTGSVTTIGGTSANWNLLVLKGSGGSTDCYLNGTPAATLGAVFAGVTALSLSGYGGHTTNVFNGDIAAVLVYDSALSASNRTKVENYLAAKYGLTNITNFSAANNGPGTVSLSWTAVPYASNYTVQRSPDDTTWTTIKELNNTTTYEDTGLAANTTYYYRVRAGSNSYGEWWGWTASESVTTTDPPPVTSGLVLWLDASYATYQSSGGSAAVSDGDVVGEWQDQSGNGNDVTQATGTAKPTLQTAELNGRPVLRFDGSNDYLETTVLPDLRLAGEVWVVCKYLGSLSAYGAVWGVNTTPNSTGNVLAHSGSSAGYLGIGLTQPYLNIAEDVSSNGTGAFILRYTNTAGAFTYKAYGGANKSISGSLAVTTGTASTLSLGVSRNDVGTRFYGLNYDLAAVLVYDSALSDADREAVEAYLINRYGL